ncbi:MAG: hypothetical protein MR277_05660 [Methanobrevibacter ruminantium]|uniref:hypothetical protein n=1 Tax=Methanobrevibacter ruminantium TaxID=83816 RepID=UPI0026EC481C|nr:hypothetical protein [Methanobrevibacter ruminantium]MCI5737478.1 hypothetical protein [Methanobrevibacter ruminantium]
MIEDRIQILRRAAKVSSRENNEHVWCVIAGNEKLVDDIAYQAITAKDRVQILFRESIKILDKYTSKRFDCIMLKGETLKISELRNRCNEKGGASVEITNVHINEMPNLLVIVGPEESMKSFNGKTNRQNEKINILAEDHTSSFIKAELNTRFKLPSFLRNTVTPILDMSDVVLSAILVSVIDENDIEHVKEISQNNSLFGIDLNKTIQDKENQRIFEVTEKDKANPQEENKTEDNNNPDNTIETPEEDKTQE